MLYESTTTLNEIRVHSPCSDGWTKLLAHLGKTQADDEPLSLITILNSNDFDDALWCLRAASLERLSRHFQAWCAEQVLHHYEAAYPGDRRVRTQIEMLKNDNAAPEQRDAAQDAARSAARSAARADAWSAAWSAAASDAWSTAWHSARVAALNTRWSAVQDAADAARAAQEAQLRKMIGGE